MVINTHFASLQARARFSGPLALMANAFCSSDSQPSTLVHAAQLITTSGSACKIVSSTASRSAMSKSLCGYGSTTSPRRPQCSTAARPTRPAAPVIKTLTGLPLRRRIACDSIHDTHYFERALSNDCCFDTTRSSLRGHSPTFPAAPNPAQFQSATDRLRTDDRDQDGRQQTASETSVFPTSRALTPQRRDCGADCARRCYRPLLSYPFPEPPVCRDSDRPHRSSRARSDRRHKSESLHR